jgi:hypothetical protein
MRSYSKKMRPGREVNILTPRYYVFSLRAGREVNLLTPRYYVFSLRGETGDFETRHYRWVYLK